MRTSTTRSFTWHLGQSIWSGGSPRLMIPARWSRCSPPLAPYPPPRRAADLDVEEFSLKGVLFDEFPPRLDLFAHQNREHPLGLDRILDRHFEERALRGIHRRLPDVGGVHLAQSFEARDFDALLPHLTNPAENIAQRVDEDHLTLVGQAILRLALDILRAEIFRHHEAEPLDLLERGLDFAGAGEFVQGDRGLRAVSRPLVIVRVRLDLAARLLLLLGDPRVERFLRIEVEILPLPARAVRRKTSGLPVVLRQILFHREALPLDKRHRILDFEDRLDQQAELRALEFPRRPLERRPFEPEIDKDARHVLLVMDVFLVLLPLEPVKRRLGDVNVAGVDQLPHVAEEEREEQRPDVAPVHIRVGHDDDLAVPELRQVEVVVADARSDRADDDPDLLVLEHLVDARLLDVENLAFERQDRLELPVAALLGRAAGRIALDDGQLAGLE